MSFKKFFRNSPASSPSSSIGRVLAAGLLAIAVTGCASVYEGKYDWKEGWREGTVVQIGTASELGKPQFSDCREKLPAQQVASGQFASVSYSHMTRKRRRVTPLQAGESFRPGEEVYVNVSSCTAPLVHQAAGPR